MRNSCLVGEGPRRLLKEFAKMVVPIRAEHTLEALPPHISSLKRTTWMQLVGRVFAHLYFLCRASGSHAQDRRDRSGDKVGLRNEGWGGPRLRGLASEMRKDKGGMRVRVDECVSPTRISVTQCIYFLEA